MTSMVVKIEGGSSKALSISVPMDSIVTPFIKEDVTELLKTYEGYLMSPELEKSVESTLSTMLEMRKKEVNLIRVHPLGGHFDYEGSVFYLEAKSGHVYMGTLVLAELSSSLYILRAEAGSVVMASPPAEQAFPVWEPIKKTEFRRYFEHSSLYIVREGSLLSKAYERFNLV